MDFSKVKPKINYSAVPLDKCLAKTRIVHSDGIDKCEPGCSLYVHLWCTCQILRKIREMWQGYPIADLIPVEAEWLAAMHDIGKCTPSFLSKIYNAVGWDLPWGKTIPEDSGGHARNSETILYYLFGKDFARLAGEHHGGSSWNGPDTLTKEELGGDEWEKIRESLIQKITTDLALPTCDLKHIASDKAPLILGVTILADWLSSGMELPDSAICSREDIAKVIKRAGIQPATCQSGASFEKLFGFSPNFLQQNCLTNIIPGGIYVIESEMGSGKTEAALGIAYQLLSQKKANGIYFAMPTRLTSEKIYDRLNLFLQKTLSAKEIKPLLIHGEAWLDNFLPQPPNADGAEPQRHTPGSWFQTKKRALLAQFGAGTIDQALMAVVNCRHRDLRAFALAGKVVIFDEVHSYDCYTQTLLTTLIKKLRHWGATVVILSATLTHDARNRLLGTNQPQTTADYPYPSLSIASPGQEKIRTIPIKANSSIEIKLSSTSNELDAIRSALERAAMGEEVLWIENTVGKAQQLFQVLAGEARNIEIGLIHSRFPVIERRNRENKWVDLLGKGGVESRCGKGRILIATQILEQSVDVDADYLITRLAPCDMLFQRLGRLWRHPTLNRHRPACAYPHMLLLYPEEVCTPEKNESLKSALLPYEPYFVMRTMEVWKTLSSISLPTDIRPTLEKVYKEREEKDVMATLYQDVIRKRQNLELQAGISCGTAGKPSSDECFGTRINDEESVQVLLLKKDNSGDDLKKVLHPFVGENIVKLPDSNASYQEKTKAAAELLKVMINVRTHIAPTVEDFPVDFLRNVLWIGDNEDHPIRAAYVDESGLLLSVTGLPCECKNYELAYHPELGYCANKKSRKD